MVNLGIIGNGFVGNATSQFANNNVNVFIFDASPEKSSPEGITLKKLCEVSDIIFICLPTPMQENGACYLGIIEGVVNEMKDYIDFNELPVVLRSTVPVGTAKKLNCFFMPEFLTEANAAMDFRNTECWIFGTKEKQRSDENKHFYNLINTILTSNVECGNICNSQSQFVESNEAEAIKLFKNTFLAVKVGFCNEFYRFCEANQVDYSKVIEGVVTDSRITQSHTRVPGNNGQFGFGGTCFPKDISSLQYQMKSAFVESPITNAVIFRNNTIDRAEQDWKLDQGRAFIGGN